MTSTDAVHTPTLIERLEKATGPSRELDFAIFGEPQRSKLDTLAPLFTASIDAARTLLDPIHYWICAKGRTRPNEPLYGIEIYDASTGIKISEAEHELESVCIILAALKLRAAKDSSHGQ